MFSLFKRKPAHGASPFKERVEHFWKWYSEVAPRITAAIAAKKCSSLSDEVNAAVDKLGLRFAWVFGAGPDKQGDSFTLTGEANLHLQLLTLYWLSRAPKIDAWTFYAARQPGEIQGCYMEIGGRKFNPIEFWVTPTVNAEAEKVDLVVWHPLFEVMEEQARWSVLFLFLDEVLGEYGTQQFIGRMSHEPKRLSESIALLELREFLERVKKERGWKKLPPGEAATGYQMKDQHTRFLRGDVVVGTTMHPKLVDEYLRSDGELKDPLKGTGADYVFVAFDSGILPKGSETNARARIEDALDQALRVTASGRLLGGAWGTTNAYIDLLLFAGAGSIEVVIKTLRACGLPIGTSLNYFAKEKRGHRVVM